MSSEWQSASGPRGPGSLLKINCAPLFDHANEPMDIIFRTTMIIIHYNSITDRCFWRIFGSSFIRNVENLKFTSLYLGVSATREFRMYPSVHIVYMGKRPHDDLELITSSHHDMLAHVLGSKQESAASMVYSYKHGFSGFAAKLTKSQVQRIADLPGVIQVIPNGFYKVQTTRSWNYLGLSSNSPNNLLHETNMGDGSIIGVIDTGIWPENEAFNDKGLGPIPKKWKGFCESGVGFNATTNCNKKIIGARYFIKGYLAEYGKPFNATEFNDYLSPRDTIRHGTHTASTAGGSLVDNVSYKGLATGTIKGGAPKARLAIYKVGWNGGSGAFADVLKAIDEAIHDGVDVLSLSLGLDIPLYAEMDKRDPIYFGSFHAVAKGIIVVCSAGNSGPIAGSVEDLAPWVLTIAASTIDRSFPTPIILGNNQSFIGQAVYTGTDTGFTSLIYREHLDIEEVSVSYCDSLSENDTWVAGHVVLCFHTSHDEGAIEMAREGIKQAGALGMIVAKMTSKTIDIFIDDFPCVQVNYETGTKLLHYLRSSRNPQVRLRPSKTHIGRPISTSLAYFSSRGPNTITPAILKPDIAAPGVNIFAAVAPSDISVKSEYAIMSGTSMAAPHVSGIVALLKSLHPNWSPAAIKSALVTTAWTTDPHSGTPIFAEGDTTKLADPFDFGGGIVNPNSARDPGLIYDMGTSDYIHYLCAKGYNNTAISQLVGQAISCPKSSLSILDLNFPSITIPDVKGSITISRTVTNVGAVNSKYKAKIDAPKGFTVVVKPEILVFNSKTKRISFAITISTSYNYNTEYCFGSLSWTDGKHNVRSPISVKSEFPDLYEN
ncbi:hypothetical protein ACH5RR_017301 [Cinchona calisaya]|uniref:Uncharacterized protein n=1 Tax=Cinchona calisaya TaxID=153742 RepID=A0ABD3A119_9GENT